VSPSPSPASGSSSSPDAQAAVDAALRDAAAHLGVSVADLKVEQVEEREWADSSLGCPRPGIMHSQIITHGFLIVISAPANTGVKTLEYHTDARGRVVLCKES
jgi:hypothetical protein